MVKNPKFGRWTNLHIKYPSVMVWKYFIKLQFIRKLQVLGPRLAIEGLDWQYEIFAGPAGLALFKKKTKKTLATAVNTCNRLAWPAILKVLPVLWPAMPSKFSRTLRYNKSLVYIYCKRVGFVFYCFHKRCLNVQLIQFEMALLEAL